MPAPLQTAPPSDWSADGSQATARRRKSVSRPRERASIGGWDPNSIERRQSYDYRPDEDAHLDPGEFSGLVSLDDLRPALPELVPPSPSLNAIEATQHRRVKDRAPNAYDQQQAAQRRASEIAMAQQQQAVMAQQTSPARVLGSRRAGRPFPRRQQMMISMQQQQFLMQQAQAQQAVLAMQQASVQPAAAPPRRTTSQTRRASQGSAQKHPAAAAGWRRG